MLVTYTFACGHTEDRMDYEPVPETDLSCPPCDLEEWRAELQDRLLAFRFMLNAGRLAREKAREGNESHAAVWASMAAHWAGKLVAA